MYHALEEVDDVYTDRTRFNLETYKHLKVDVDVPELNPRRFLPAVAWEHHHHATVKLVNGLRRKAGKDEIIDSTEVAASLSPAPKHRAGDKSNSATIETLNKARKMNPVAMLWDSFVNRPKLVSECSEWKRLQKHSEHLKTQHLRDLLQDKARSDYMFATYDGVYLDYSRQRVNFDTMKFLFELAKKQNLAGQIQAMIRGDKINFTEKRAVLHTALRAGKEEIGTVIVDDMDVIQEVHAVLDQIKEFTDGVRSGKILGYTGKRLRNIVSVGIGGSYLGPEFLHECLKTEPEGVNSALGYR